jgi:voltage-gated potassium channel
MHAPRGYVSPGDQGIIAVPTGIVSVELAQVTRAVSTQACPACGRQGHDVDARHCKYCGVPL